MTRLHGAVAPVVEPVSRSETEARLTSATNSITGSEVDFGRGPEIITSFTINSRPVDIGDPWTMNRCGTNDFRITCETCSGDSQGRVWRVWNSSTADFSNGTLNVGHMRLQEERRSWYSDRTNDFAATANRWYVNDSWPRWASDGRAYAQRARFEIVNDPIPDDPEQAQEYLRAQERRRREQEARWAQQQREREQADDRAEILLRSCLTPEQQRSLDENNWFLVNGPSGRRYRIRRGSAINIDVLDELGNVSHKLCFHPRSRVPVGDTMLSQKLMLEACEDEALRIANRHAA